MNSKNNNYVSNNNIYFRMEMEDIDDDITVFYTDDRGTVQ